MHWQLPVVLLLTAFVSSAHSAICGVYANEIQRVDNLDRSKSLNAKAKFSTKVTSMFGIEQNVNPDMKESVKRSLAFGASFRNLVEKENDRRQVSRAAKDEVRKQVSQISKEKWMEMAVQAMDKQEEREEEFTVPPGSSVLIFQLRVTCSIYFINLPKNIKVTEAISSEIWP